MRRIRPAAWEFLHDASKPSLESFELSRLNHAANLRREIAALLDQWIEDTSQALLARWVRKERAAPPDLEIRRGAVGSDAGADITPRDDDALLPLAEPPPSAPPRPAERSVKLARRAGRIPPAC